MVYMGSKSKYAEEIVPILQSIIDENEIEVYAEPFVGGANIIDKIKCNSKIGVDKSLPLVALHIQAQTDPSIIPSTGNREWWDEAKEIYRKYESDARIKEEMEPWKIGAISFLGSFNNGGFSRGYAKEKDGRDPYNEAYRNFMKQIESPLYKDITFFWGDYTTLNISNGLIYCDPPYAGTKPYGYKFETGFDYEKYWDWVREQSQRNWVICSEQAFPEDFEIIWEKKVTRSTNKENNFKATEKLGRYKYGLR